MEQKIVNIKAGQKFIIIDNAINGFPIDAIVEAQETIRNCRGSAGIFRLIGGVDENHHWRELELNQRVSDLKRYRGKIK